MKTLIISIILAANVAANAGRWDSDVVGGVAMDLGGWRGTVVCFHGANAPGEGGAIGLWGEPGTPNNLFMRFFKRKGWSYVAPPSADRTWSDIEGPHNPDVAYVDAILSELGAPPPYFFVGHSNGGEFAIRMARYGYHKPAVIQLANSYGVWDILQSHDFRIPVIFSYSYADKVIGVEAVYGSMWLVESKGDEISEQDVTEDYDERDTLYHEFINTAAWSWRKLNYFLSK